eukprot:g14725.t1
MRWSLGGLVVLLGGREALAKVTVKPGRYFLVNRDFGTFLRDEGLGLRDDDALWRRWLSCQESEDTETTRPRLHRDMADPSSLSRKQHSFGGQQW